MGGAGLRRELPGILFRKANADPDSGKAGFLIHAPNKNRQGGPAMKKTLLAFLLALAAPAFAQQTAPEIAFDSVADFPKLPEGMNFGEVPGVAVDSKGN